MFDKRILSKCRYARILPPIFLVSIIFLPFPNLSAADDLLTTYALAQENDPKYGKATSVNQKAREVRPQALSALLPNIAFDYLIARNDQESRRGNPFRQKGDFYFTSKKLLLTITQPLLRTDDWIELKKANRQVRKANLTFLSTKQSLMMRVCERYFDALAATDELVFAQSEKKATWSQLEQAQRQFDEGFTDITDLRETQAQYDLAVAEEIETRNQLDNAYEELWEITGRYTREIRPLAEEIPLTVPEPDDMEQWTKTALAQNPELTAAQEALKIAEMEIKRINATHLPTLDLVGTHDRYSSDDGQEGEMDTRTSSIGLQLNIPIYQGGLVMSQSRQARHDYNIALNELLETRRSIQRKTREAFLGIRSYISRVTALQQALRSMQTALESIEIGAQVGTKTFVEVLDAQSDVFEVKKDYASAHYSYILDVLRLKQAAGILSEKDIATVNNMLTSREQAQPSERAYREMPTD
uniref:Outer membrane protein n=1 Tax=Candidatus Kentrum sp. FM TaxID=2126340 RepID=A0A450TXC6_9GAMM|nr:MAG: outer membrane protein [Candidatus Kentron sp. FM]VFJ73952.1 MAG: outer membrane protein [Candidatus Kentron sp. FM]VFK12712.1 MAG: outer membrane protein [Candidatus Kentron sp. FM]